MNKGRKFQNNLIRFERSNNSIGDHVPIVATELDATYRSLGIQKYQKRIPTDELDFEENEYEMMKQVSLP